MDEDLKMGTADTNFCYHCDELLAGKCCGAGKKGALCETKDDIFCRKWDKMCEPFRKLRDKNGAAD